MYNKLFSKILDSSIWLAPDTTRIVWVTLLASMDSDGFAHFAALQNLARRANVSTAATKKAVDFLEGPDPDSSDPDHEGRRIERAPGGWYVLNAKKYADIVSGHESRRLNRERQARWAQRARKNAQEKAESNAGLTAPNADLTAPNARLTQSDTDTDTDTDPVPQGSIRTEGTRTVRADRKVPVARAERRANDPPVRTPKDVLTAFDVVRQKRFPGVPWKPDGRDAKHAKELLRYEQAEIERRIEVFFKKTEPIYANNGYRFAFFRAMFDACIPPDALDRPLKESSLFLEKRRTSPEAVEAMLREARESLAKKVEH